MFLSTQNIQYKYAQKISALRNFGKKESGYPCFQSSLFAETPAFLRHVFVWSVYSLTLVKIINSLAMQ